MALNFVNRIPFLFVASILAAVLVMGCQSVDTPATELNGGGKIAKALATLPVAFREDKIAEGLASPTAMAIAPDGRVFVCEKGGKLRVVKAGVLQTTAFLSQPVNSEGERGLLGVAFDPNFATTRHVFIYYTTYASPRHNRLSRFTASLANPDIADGTGETILLDLDNLSTATNHNGGAIHFGTDGKLYIAVGENSTTSNAQSMTSLLGKMLRINRDGSIPTDNPFYASATGNYRAIWALGLRNPFTFAIQPTTGKIFINDVGWMEWEEINVGRAGANYGWPTTEGATTNPVFDAPYYTYYNTSRKGTGPECAIIGGAFYNPITSTFPAEYAGDYFYGDYCGGWIKRMDVATKTISGFAAGISGLTDIQVGDDGSLYYLSFNSGLLMKVTYTGSQAPTISQHPNPVTITVGGSASFSIVAAGSGLAYQWFRNAVEITDATSASYVISITQLSDSGSRFTCRVTNTYGTVTSQEALLHVTANKPPLASVLTPDTTYRFRAGETLAYSGSGVDPEDGVLAATQFTWQVDLHHEVHFHPLLPAMSGAKSGSLTIPAEGETSPNVWLRFHLTVADKAGLTHKVFRDIQPRTAMVTLATNPVGLQISLDGSGFTGPFAFRGVSGMRRTIGAISQTLGLKSWEFVSWSDSGAGSHSITTPDLDKTITALFREVLPNEAPTASIILPDTAFRYRANTTLAYSGTGMDPEEGALTGSAFTWSVDLFHDAISVPLVVPTKGAVTGSVAIPNDVLPATDVWLRFYLTVADKQGLTHQVQRDIRPLKTNITLLTSPPGLNLTLDGQTVTGPYTFSSVVGARRLVEGVTHPSAGKTWQFLAWSDGGSSEHEITTPDGALALTANFQEATGNRAPAALIVSPTLGTLYQAGTTLSFSGTGSDPEDGDILAAGFTWRVNFHHDGISTTVLPTTTGIKSGSFDIPTVGETSTSVFYRITLTVRDKEGLTHTLTRDILPQTVSLTLASVPNGLNVLLDGRDRVTPYIFSSVVGGTRTLAAASQTSGGKSWIFTAWSDAGAANHTTVTPSTPATFTATFQELIANQPPIGTILTPSVGALYEGGAAINYSASGTDPEDGTLPDSAFSWRVDFHRGILITPILPVVAGIKSGVVTVPSTGVIPVDGFYRIHLTVKDRWGLSHTLYRDVLPKTVEITLATIPTGLKLQLDGLTIATPHVFTGVAGMKRNLTAFPGQDMGGKTWNFGSWSTAMPAAHVLITPTASATITATYKEAVSTGIHR